MAQKYIIGIDEVGRGPLAGPVAVGLVVMETEKYKQLIEQGTFEQGKDSKKLTPKKRAECFLKIRELKEQGFLNYGVFFESNDVVDRFGIAQAIRMAIKKGLEKISLGQEDVQVLLDGGLKAPKEYENQESIIRGDESELVIALASIAAKETRDELMVKMAKKYPDYGFENHMGYGTKAHLESLKKSGYSDIHRQSFLRNFEFFPRKTGEN
jgi:ribonuclease HII